METKKTITLLWLLGVSFGGFTQQIERTTLRAMTALTSPDAKKIYRVSDSDKQGDWQYDPNDDTSIPNVGTVLGSTKRNVSGRFRRIYDPADGVQLDWFLTRSLASGSVNDALLMALSVSERVNFGRKIYPISPINITPKQLQNPKRLQLHFDNSTLQAARKLSQVQVIRIGDVATLALTGTLTLDGNAAHQQIKQPFTQGGQAFLEIMSPERLPTATLQIGSITIQNMPMCGLNIDTPNHFQSPGYDRITARAFREINGFNHLNIQQDGFAVWGINVRGAHRAVLIDSLFAQQDNEPWGDAPIEKPFYTFTFENQIDPSVHRRKDSLYIKNLYANYPCAIVLYTQGINHVLVDNYLIENTLRKPNIPNERAYPTLLRNNISWIGSKHTWTSYGSPKSSFRIKKMNIKNTNPVFMSQDCANDMTGLWLNKGIAGAMLDEVETDVRIKLHGDGYYFGFANVPDGNHRIGKFTCRIPDKRNYVQPLNADLTIDQLHLAAGTGVIFAMGNAKIGAITQENGTYATFESRENRFKNTPTRHNGFIVQSCQATHILWRFNWTINAQNLLNDNAQTAGERYEFSNFSGNNLLQTHTNVALQNAKSVYVSAYKYDSDAKIQAAVQHFLQWVEFNWSNVKMKLADQTPSDLTRRYAPTNASGLFNLSRRSRLAGWKNQWQPNRFERCSITP